MSREGRWIMGAVTVILGLLGLFLAAHAHDPGLYYAGLALSVCATLFVFFMIKRAYDQAGNQGEGS